jgi:hypothetical protein
MLQSWKRTCCWTSKRERERNTRLGLGFHFHSSFSSSFSTSCVLSSSTFCVFQERQSLRSLGTFGKARKEGGRGAAMCAAVAVAMQSGSSSSSNGVVTLPLPISSPSQQAYISELLSFSLERLHKVFIIFSSVCECWEFWVFATIFEP